MKITSAAEFLNDHGFEYPSLSVLRANQDIYRALLVQPEADIFVGIDEIKNFDRERSERIFGAAIKLASDCGAELVVTPEYSVPWDAIKAAFEAGFMPSNGALWVFGCESIPINTLEELRAKFSPWAVVIHELVNEGAVEPKTAKYLNPLVYIFKARVKNEEREAIVMLIQFKTYPSGDPDNTEVVSMAKGNNVYIFDKFYQEVRLISLICSDSLNFKDEDVDSCYEGTLVIHIQLNDRPRERGYSNYRRRMFGMRCDRTEILCLNWSENLKFRIGSGTNEVQKKNIAASTWHTATEQADTKDVTVEKNHKFGFYYTRDDKEKRHMLNFWYGSAVFLMEASKVKHVGVPAGVSYRHGPKVSAVFKWNESSSSWESVGASIDDGFLGCSKDYVNAACDLQSLYEKSPLAVERVAAITKGGFLTGDKWYEAANLSTARTSGDEVVNLLTTVQDPDGENARTEHLSHMDALLSLKGRIPFKPQLVDLQEGFSLHWEISNPSCNVVSQKDGEKPATLIFAGAGRPQSYLAGLYAKAADLAQRGGNRDRFSVVYMDGVHPMTYVPKNPNSIDGAEGAGKNFMEPEK